MAIKGDQGTSRAMNRRLILNLLRREGPKSRAEIAAVTGLSPAAVTFVIADLIEESYVVEGQTIKSTSGRRPVPVDINYAGGLAVGFKLMAGSVECVVTDLATNPLGSMHVALADHRPETIADTLAATIPSLIALADHPTARLAGIGVSLPGVVNNELAICVRSNRYNWDNVPLAQLLAQRVNLPVWLEDDTFAYGIAQQLYGLGRQHKNMAVLAIGVGIACAIIIDNKLYRGNSGAAGRFGHVTHVKDGLLCECGKRGCLMNYYSEPAIIKDWGTRTGRGMNVHRSEMHAALKNGDKDAIAVLEEAGKAIGRHLAGLINLIDPEVVVVGGEAVAFGAAFFDPLRAALREHAFRTPPPILPDWADNSWARGAAALVTQRLFDFETSAGSAAGNVSPTVPP